MVQFGGPGTLEMAPFGGGLKQLNECQAIICFSGGLVEVRYSAPVAGTGGGFLGPLGSGSQPSKRTT